MLGNWKRASQKTRICALTLKPRRPEAPPKGEVSAANFTPSWQRHIIRYGSRAVCTFPYPTRPPSNAGTIRHHPSPRRSGIRDAALTLLHKQPDPRDGPRPARIHHRAFKRDALKQLGGERAQRHAREHCHSVNTRRAVDLVDYRLGVAGRDVRDVGHEIVRLWVNEVDLLAAGGYSLDV